MNTAQTVTIAPNADFHLFISAGASAFVWIALGFLFLVFLFLWIVNTARRQHGPKRQETRVEKEATR